MLDIKFIRDNKEVIALGAKKKRMDFDVDALIKVDDERRDLLQIVEKKRAEQNAVGIRIASATPEEKEQLVTEMSMLKSDMRVEEEKLKEVMGRWRTLMLQVPNVPDMSVPEGADDSENQEIKTWGEKPQHSFAPRSHIDLADMHNLADFKRGTKVSGFRGYMLKNEGALLAMAVWHFAMDRLVKKGFEAMIVPSLVNQELLLGTGYLPGGEDDLYKTQDDQYLAGTAEVATMGSLMDEVVETSELPKKMISASPCFRREAGSHGKDTRGLMRVHEFYKIEQVALCEANHEASVALHEELQKNVEDLIQELGLPYRVVINCGGDLGQGQVKKYDTELWVPSENTYREISSASYFHDFQTRRLNIKYRDNEGKMQFAHSLNSTALPTPRILIAILEHYQNEDGTVTIPEALRPYLGKDTIG